MEPLFVFPFSGRSTHIQGPNDLIAIMESSGAVRDALVGKRRENPLKINSPNQKNSIFRFFGEEIRNQHTTTNERLG